jgi:nickel-dependent lactate racemase
VVDIRIPAGGREHNFTIPDKNLLSWHIPPQVPPIPADRLPGVIRNALEKPIQATGLPDLLDGAQAVTLIVDDWARPNVTRHAVAPIVLDLLNEYGIEDDQITVVMARGLALCPEIEIIQAAFGQAILGRNVRTVISGYHPSQLAFLGYSSLGTPIWVDQTVVGADLVIGIGTIVPTSWGGWSGGAKIIAPGVAGAETIRQNHSLMMKIVPGSLNNPGLRDREEIARIAGLDLLVNVLVNVDGEITELAAGETVATHRHLVDVYRRHYQVEVSGKPDVIITTLDRFKGYPQSAWYITADGCLPAVELIADPGATVIVVGSCPQGVGGGAREYMRTAYTLEDLAFLLPQCGVFGSSSLMFGTHFAFQRERYNIKAVVEGMSEAACADIGIGWAASVQDALDEGLSRHGGEARVAVIAALGNILLPVIPKRRQG